MSEASNHNVHAARAATAHRRVGGGGVLIVAKVTQGAAGTYADYLDAKAQPSQLGDYYLKDGERIEAPGRWAGGADQFGLDPAAAVTGEQLRTLMAVQRPDTGQQLRRVGGSGEAVAAIDATFSAPKSVSAAWALARPELREHIEAAHETAIDCALTYATGQVPMLRRRVAQDTVVHEKAKGVIATSWRHTTARAVEDQVPDPQLHSHVLLHAAIRQDGEVVAIDSRAWLTHQREVGAAYRSHLAHELHRLGFGVHRGTGRGERYFELDGIPQGLIDRWSSRHHQVQAAIQDRIADQQRDLQTTITTGGPAAIDAARQLQALHESGQLSPGQERLMGTVTRAAKLPVTTQDLDQAWRRTARAHQFSAERVHVLTHHPHDQPLAPAPAGVVLDALTQFDATFPARDARAVALERSAGAPIDTALDQLTALREGEEILVLADGTGTTRNHRGRERTVVAITQRLTQARVPALPAELVDREARRLDDELAAQGGRLSAEQRSAIHLACGPQPLVVIEGQAGTGKSTALTGIARAHQATGRQVLVTSTAALAAERLAGELTHNGVTCHAYSTAALTAAIHHGRVALTPATTIIHDEAALASTSEQLGLLDAVDISGARLIAVGDPQQNQPVGAGGLWAHIQTAADDAGALTELTINQRAQDAGDRRDQKLFRDGHAERAIRGYAARDHLHIADESRRAEDQALEAAHRDRSRGQRTIVIAQTSNEHLDALNARAQAIRHQAHQPDDPGLPIPGRPYAIHAGDEIQIRHTTPHPNPDHDPIRNGTHAHALHTNDETLRLQLDDGEQITLTAQQAADADVRLAYVQHPFPAQGQTTDTSHLLVADHATREGTYVALTRARQATSIYAATIPEPGSDRLQTLADHVNRSEPDAPSIHTPIDRARHAQTPQLTPIRGDAPSPRPRLYASQQPERQPTAHDIKNDQPDHLLRTPAPTAAASGPAEDPATPDRARSGEPKNSRATDRRWPTPTVDHDDAHELKERTRHPGRQPATDNVENDIDDHNPPRRAPGPAVAAEPAKERSAPDHERDAESGKPDAAGRRWPTPSTDDNARELEERARHQGFAP